jgi:uncharacterized protein YuzE
MANIEIYYDAEGKTLSVWFDSPEKEHMAEETGEEVLLIKDTEGHVIGFERLNFELAEDQTIELHTAAV